LKNGTLAAGVNIMGQRADQRDRKATARPGLAASLDRVGRDAVSAAVEAGPSS